MFVKFYPKLIEWASETMNMNGGAPMTTAEMMRKLKTLLLDPSYTNIMLYSTVFATIMVLLFCRIIEGRRFRTMGFTKKHFVLQYLFGMGAGFAMFSLIVLLAYAMGGLKWNGFQGGSVSGIVIVFFGFFLQGMSEEVIFRGYLMTTILRHQNIWWAVGVNSVLFALVHNGNKGFSIMAFINLILYAVMISFYMLRTGNLWGACALHSIWNFVQGNFYGLPVSGVDSGAKVFSMSLQEGKTLLNGGDFGLEASLATTIVMIAAIAVLVLIPYRPKEETESA